MELQGRCVVTEEEILDSWEIRVMESILKSKGAPIKGVVNLSLDDDYEFTFIKNAMDHTTCVEWNHKTITVPAV